jgi:hypothetical protein
MWNEASDRRTRFYNRITKAGLIGSVFAFGSLVALVLLPVDRSVGLVVAGAAVFLLMTSAFVMIGAIAARDIPLWKKNRWRFSMRDVLTVMMFLGVTLGALAAAVRDVSPGSMLLAFVVLLILAYAISMIHINWSRFRHFNAMNAEGRYLDWNSVAERLSRGEGTIILTTSYPVPTVWWSERRIYSVDEARSAIASDAIITNCPRGQLTFDLLKSTFSTIPVIDIRTGKTNFDS